MKTTQQIYLFSIILTLAILTGCRSQQETHLIAYIGSGMKKPMLELKQLYEMRNPHVTIDYSFSGSKILEQTVRTLKQGDIIMPGDKKYIESLQRDGLIVAQYPIALHIPMVITLKENTLINTWQDLAQEGVKLCIPNPDMASIGKLANIIFQRSPLGPKIQERITLLSVDTDESVKFLLERQVDAVISWDSMLEIAPDKLKMVEIPPEINEIEQIWIAVTTFAKDTENAMTFAKFVASAEGIAVFEKMNFSPLK
jgi:molybdate transport system substrate-binding protein